MNKRCTDGMKVVGLLASLLALPPPVAAAEADGVVKRLLASPTITPAVGFRADLLTAPGQLYDPLWLQHHDGAVWLNDDGGEEGDKGSRIVAIGRDGKVAVVVGLGRLLPVTGYGFAPASFGKFAGQLYSIAQAKVAAPGAVANHVIQRIDPTSKDGATVVCELKETGTVNQGISGLGVDARFGPAGTPFADRFFAAAAFNNTIYQVRPDHTCSPFVTFTGALAGAPMGLAFSGDGQWLLVTLRKGGILDPPNAGDGVVVRVSAAGVVDAKPVVVGLLQPMGIMVAPADFGSYGGQLFITDIGNIQAPVPMTQALNADGKVYRVAADGMLQLVASGFVNPVGMLVVDGALWVTDINGDFIAGKRELPDGFVIKLTPVAP